MSKDCINNSLERSKEASSDIESLKFFDNERFFELVRNTEFKIAQEKAKEKALKKGLKEGKEEGLKEGENIGSDKKAMEIAKNMLDAKMDLDTISKVTGLSLEIIKSLREEKDTKN